MRLRFSDLFEIRSGVPIRQAYEKMAAGGTPVIVPKVVDVQKESTIRKLRVWI